VTQDENDTKWIWCNYVGERSHFDGWAYFSLGAELIRNMLGMSLGFAETKLRELCASGNIRSMKYDDYDDTDDENPPEPEIIKPSEWVHNQIDLSLPWHVTLTVNIEDLEYWLKDRVAVKPEPTEPRTSHKRDQARQAVEALWPNGVPNELVNKQIEQKVAEWLKAKGLPEISRDTILRSAGRK
jgi:hypothetical protein